ncbi:MAG: NAD(P)/FAD-dependent oxidoreductase [Sarcina sp.]
MIYHDLVILGGGASGLMASIAARDFGLDVALVEGNDRVGKKILTTGNGRCNITNSLIAFPFLNYHSSNDGFYCKTLNKFSVEDTKAFFLNVGLPIVELTKGRNYPQSLQASSVVDIFRFAMEDRAVPLYSSFKVSKIEKRKDKFILFTKDSTVEPISCSKLVLATGGRSAIATGSDGSGYNLAESLGHKVIWQSEGIVQLKLEHPALKALSGIKFDGFAEVISNGNSLRKEFGEILFTNYGISGPPILQISREAARRTEIGEDVKIVVDLSPDKSKEELEAFLEGHFAMIGHRKVVDSLVGVINKKLIPIILREAGIRDLQKPCYDLSWKEKASLFKLFKHWEFKCIGGNGFNAAQVTIGGVDTKDINPETLESKIHKNLYFCGEILDVDGDCGGFNLQWAWSSGYNVALSCSIN